MEKAGQEKKKKGLKKRENLENFREHKLSKNAKCKSFNIILQVTSFLKRLLKFHKSLIKYEDFLLQYYLFSSFFWIF